MSDDTATLALIQMKNDHDPRLPQYVVYLHRPDGWTLRQIARAIGVSPEWVRQLELKGMRQITEGDRKDLSDLPDASRRRIRTVKNVAEYLPPETVEMLATMNKQAAAYRGHKEGREQLDAFNKMVQLLLEAGVPINSIADALGERRMTFYRRMRRWDVRVPAFEEHRKVVEAEPARQCDDPTCPIRGAHQHG